MNTPKSIQQPMGLATILPPLAILLAIYAPALYDLTVDWYTDSNYSHGFLVPLVSAYLLWQKRDVLLSTPIGRDNKGLVIVLMGIALFILGNGAAEYFTLRFSFVMTLFGLVYFFFGKEIIKKAWFEILFLLFMIPIPYVLYYSATLPMQLLASKITAGVLNLIGMGVFRQGNIIHIQGYSLEVAEACSGMRSLISLLALGALYAHLTQKRFASKLILFASTVPIAIVSNVFRVFVTSLLAYTVTDNVTQEPLHTIMGLLVFVVAFILLFITGFILNRVFK